MILRIIIKLVLTRQPYAITIYQVNDNDYHYLLDLVIHRGRNNIMSFLKSFKFKGTALLSAVLFLSVGLTACGSATPKQEAAGSSTTPAATQAGAPHKVKHAMGETEVPANPKRVVILTNEGTEALLSLGVKPVGAVKSFTGNPWY